MSRALTRIFHASESKPEVKITGAVGGAGAVAPDCCVRDHRGIQCERAAGHKTKHGFDSAYGEWVEFTDGFVPEEQFSKALDMLAKLLPLRGREQRLDDERAGETLRRDLRAGGRVRDRRRERASLNERGRLRSRMRLVRRGQPTQRMPY